jgi:hypothetical protein
MCKAALVSCSTFVGSDQKPRMPNVRYWHTADLKAEAEHVSFLTESGRRCRRSKKTCH